MSNDDKLFTAAYAYVESVRDTADDKPLMWRGWALRSAFIAGAEWQQEQKEETQTEIAYDNLIQVIMKNINDVEAVAEAIKLYVVAETIEAIRTMVKPDALIGG